MTTITNCTHCDVEFTDNEQLHCPCCGASRIQMENEARMQALIDSGDVWLLEGAMGREAMAMIEAGMCMLGEEGHRDYWGNYVPSRHEVQAGTKGSPEYYESRR